MSRPHKLVLNMTILPLVAALAAAGLMWALVMEIQTSENERFLEKNRGEVLLRLGTLRANMESVVNRLAYADQSVAVYVSHHPGIDQGRYERLARDILPMAPEVRGMSLASGATIICAYPPSTAPVLRGTNLLELPAQAGAVRRVMEDGTMVLDGPVNLLEGGQGFIVRKPIYLAPLDRRDPHTFWGINSVIIDRDMLFEKAGLPKAYSDLRLAIGAVGPGGRPGAVFYGDAAVIGQKPVEQTVVVPGGHWRLWAEPVGGWPVESPSAMRIRWLGVVVSITSGLLIWLLVRGPIRLREMVRQATEALVDARDNLEQRVNQRTAELQSANAELHQALRKVKTLSGLLPICASCKKIRDDQGYWNQIEYYIRDHSDADFSHSICPDCMKKLYPEVYAARQARENGRKDGGGEESGSGA